LVGAGEAPHWAATRPITTMLASNTNKTRLLIFLFSLV
jgi:hypothetical protein